MSPANRSPARCCAKTLILPLPAHQEERVSALLKSFASTLFSGHQVLCQTLGPEARFSPPLTVHLTEGVFWGIFLANPRCSLIEAQLGGVGWVCIQAHLHGCSGLCPSGFGVFTSIVS